jgi:hypothetical protein
MTRSGVTATGHRCHPGTLQNETRNSVHCEQRGLQIGARLENERKKWSEVHTVVDITQCILVHA